MTAGHNSQPNKWHDDERCESLMRAILRLKDDPEQMEARHIQYCITFGASYVKSDFANIVRREVCLRTGREPT